MTWRGLQWAQLQQLNELCMLIMMRALADDTIMPVNRYVQGRRAFNLFLSQYPGSPVVLAYKQLINRHVSVCRVCVKLVVVKAKDFYFEAAVVQRPELYMKRQAFLEYLCPVNIDNVCLNGNIQCCLC